MKIQILDKTKKRKILDKLGYLGRLKFPYLLIQTGKERIRAYSGNLSREEIMSFWRLFPIEGIGLYFGKVEGEQARLTLDALHILKEQIRKNVIEISGEQEGGWFCGRDIELSEHQQEKYKHIEGFVAVKSKRDFIGTGKMSFDKKRISNFLPKERRRKY